MPKLLLRCVAVLLAPCLLGDPGSAAGPFKPRFIATPIPFDAQALSPHAQEVLRPLLSNWRQRARERRVVRAAGAWAGLAAGTISLFGAVPYFQATAEDTAWWLRAADYVLPFAVALLGLAGIVAMVAWFCWVASDWWLGSKETRWRILSLSALSTAVLGLAALYLDVTLLNNGGSPGAGLGGLTVFFLGLILVALAYDLIHWTKSGSPRSEPFPVVNVQVVRRRFVDVAAFSAVACALAWLSPGKRLSFDPNAPSRDLKDFDSVRLLSRGAGSHATMTENTGARPAYPIALEHLAAGDEVTLRFRLGTLVQRVPRTVESSFSVYEQSLVFSRQRPDLYTVEVKRLDSSLQPVGPVIVHDFSQGAMGSFAAGWIFLTPIRGPGLEAVDYVDVTIRPNSGVQDGRLLFRIDYEFSRPLRDAVNAYYQDWERTRDWSTLADFLISVGGGLWVTAMTRHHLDAGLTTVLEWLRELFGKGPNGSGGGGGSGHAAPRGPQTSGPNRLRTRRELFYA